MVAKKLTVTPASVTVLGEGLKVVLENGSSVVVDKTSYTKEALETKVQACLALYAAEKEAIAAVKKAKAARVSGTREFSVFANKLAPVVLSAVGEEDAARCGIEVRKAAAALTVEEAHLKAERLRATRKVRNTMGPKERLAHKGVVPALPKGPDDSGTGNKT